MKISEIITPAIPAFFTSDSNPSCPLTNRDVLSYLEHLMASALKRISRNDAAVMIAKHIESLQIPDTRHRNNILK